MTRWGQRGGKHAIAPVAQHHVLMKMLIVALQCSEGGSSIALQCSEG